MMSSSSVLLTCFTAGSRERIRRDVLKPRYLHDRRTGMHLVGIHFLITSGLCSGVEVCEEQFVRDGKSSTRCNQARPHQTNSTFPSLASPLQFLSELIVSVCKICRAPISPMISGAALRNASRLGLRRFSGHATNTGSQPLRAWTPTPYVTETIVCLPHYFRPRCKYTD